jgi:hypothetical protein
MGRLPSEFAGRRITFRVPFTMPGELTIAAGATGVQFPEATYLHNQDKPFEIHRVIPRVTALNANGYVYNPQPIESLLERLTRIRIFDVSKNENLTKNAQLLHSLVKGEDEKTWEWAEPYTLVRSEGFQVSADNLATQSIVGEEYGSTRLEVAFQGFLVVVAAPDQR